MVTLSGSGNNPGSHIFDPLQLLQRDLRCDAEQRVTVVKFTLSVCAGYLAMGNGLFCINNKTK